MSDQLTQWARSLFKEISEPASAGKISTAASVSEPRLGASMPGKDASRTVPQASHADNRVEAVAIVPQQPALRTGVASGAVDTPAPDFRYRPVTTSVRRRG